MKPPVFYQTRYVVRLRQLATSARLIERCQAVLDELAGYRSEFTDAVVEDGTVALRRLSASVRGADPGD